MSQSDFHSGPTGPAEDPQSSGEPSTGKPNGSAEERNVPASGQDSTGSRPPQRFARQGGAGVEDAGAVDADAVAADPTARTSTPLDSIVAVVALGAAADNVALSPGQWIIAIATKMVAKTWAIRRALPTSSSAVAVEGGSDFGVEAAAGFSRIFRSR